MEAKFFRFLKIVGVGFKARAEAEGRTLFLKLGYSHEIELAAPPAVRVYCFKPNIICCTGIDKRRTHQFAAAVRNCKPPEVYKGKVLPAPFHSTPTFVFHLLPSPASSPTFVFHLPPSSSNTLSSSPLPRSGVFDLGPAARRRPPFPGSGRHRRLRLSSEFRRLRLGLAVIISPLPSSGHHRRLRLSYKVRRLRLSTAQFRLPSSDLVQS
ncbi:hypothetical protein V2J09_003703 [Rumex salicifolius]